MDKIFFSSYSHKDQFWKKRLLEHLQVLQQQELVDIWEDKVLVTTCHNLAERVVDRAWCSNVTLVPGYDLARLEAILDGLMET